MNDMTKVIVPRSDQLNADTLQTGPITIKVASVSIRAGQEQPVAISFEGDEGKPYKPCKSMARVLVAAWGADASKYVGRSMTLYCDPKVRWGGMEVGGIRVSHLSHIESPLTMALTMTKGNKKPFTVKPLAQSSAPPSAPIEGVEYITPEQVMSLDARCTENGITVDGLKRAAKVERLAMIQAEDYERANGWITAAIEKRRNTQPT